MEAIMKHSHLRIGAVILLLLTMLSIVSCNGSDIEVPEGMQLCSDESLEYCFFVPAGWVVNSSSGTTGAYRALNIPVSVTVTLYSPETALNIDGYWDICEEGYKDEFKNYKFISETPTTVAKLNAMDYVYEADFSGKTYRFCQTVFIERSRFYIITYTAEAEHYETYLSDLAQMKAEMIFR